MLMRIPPEHRERYFSEFCVFVRWLYNQTQDESGLQLFEHEMTLQQLDAEFVWERATELVQYDPRSNRRFDEPAVGAARARAEGQQPVRREEPSLEQHRADVRRECAEKLRELIPNPFIK